MLNNFIVKVVLSLALLNACSHHCRSAQNSYRNDTKYSNPFQRTKDYKTQRDSCRIVFNGYYNLRVFQDSLLGMIPCSYLLLQDLLKDSLSGLESLNLHSCNAGYFDMNTYTRVEFFVFDDFLIEDIFTIWRAVQINGTISFPEIKQLGTFVSNDSIFLDFSVDERHNLSLIYVVAYYEGGVTEWRFIQDGTKVLLYETMSPD